MRGFRVVRFLVDVKQLGVRVGEKRVLNPANAAKLEADGLAEIVNDTVFPAPDRPFAGLPPPAPERRRPGRPRLEDTTP